MVEVAQEDREAYLALNSLARLNAYNVHTGVWDNTIGMQALARHRIAARKQALEEAAQKAVSIGEQYGEDETGWFECSETIATAIRALSDSHVDQD